MDWNLMVRNRIRFRAIQEENVKRFLVPIVVFALIGSMMSAYSKGSSDKPASKPGTDAKAPDASAAPKNVVHLKIACAGQVGDSLDLSLKLFIKPSRKKPTAPSSARFSRPLSSDPTGTI